MSLPEYRSQIDAVIARVKNRTAFLKSEDKRLKKIEKEDEVVKAANFRDARRTALLKLDEIALVPALFALEDLVLSLYGNPPNDSVNPFWFNRIIGRLAPFTTTTTYASGNEVRILYRQIHAGKVSPDISDPKHYTSEKVPEFSLGAVCQYSPTGILLAIHEGRYEGLTEKGDAGFTDPRVENSPTVGTSLIPIEDWSKVRVQGVIKDVLKARPELERYTKGIL